MYMEHSAADFHGDANGKKYRSLELQTFYDQVPGLALGEKQSQKDPLKKKRALVEDTSVVKKKTEKEVLLSSVTSVNKSSHEVSICGSGSTDSSKAQKSGRVQKCDNVEAVGGASLNPVGDGTHVPKRRREPVRRKKVNESLGFKMFSTNVSSGDVASTIKINGRLNEDVIRNGNVGTSEKINGDVDQDGKSTRNSVGKVNRRVKRKRNFNNHKESRSNKFDLVQQTEKAKGIVVSKRGVKRKRDQTKIKRSGLNSQDGTMEADLVLDQSILALDIPPDDNEESLEANAARMLSSRFNPTCTHSPSNNNSYRSPSCCSDTGSPRLRAPSGSDTDTADKVLRPHYQQRTNGIVSRRRHFYEVFARDLDPHWMLQRKTKVYWPLDQIWYYGKIIGFNPDDNLHHIRYDDQEEEWINLSSKRFKLLLFPSELPPNHRRRRAAEGDIHFVKKNFNVALQDSNHKTKPEPIISLLSKPSYGNKSSSSVTRKKQKMSKQSDDGRASSASFTTNDIPRCLDVGFYQKDAEEFSNNPGSKEYITVLDGYELSSMESSSKPPIVYVRRRFRRKEQGRGDGADNRSGHLTVEQFGSVVPLGSDPDMSRSVNQCGSPAGWFHHDGSFGSADDLFPLRLGLSVVKEVIRFELAWPMFMVPYYCFGKENLSLFHAAQMLHYGTLITLWPMVHLETLFVNSVFGLSFFFFEGCLKQAVKLLFLILCIFRVPNQEQKHVDGQLPVTSICFQFSIFGEIRKQLVFTFYSFSEVGISKWNYLEGQFKKDCLLARQLPPSECTYGNVKELEYSFIHLPMASVLLRASFLDLWGRIGLHLSYDFESWADIGNHKDKESIALPLHSEYLSTVQKVDSLIRESGAKRRLHLFWNGFVGKLKSPSAEQFSCSRSEEGRASPVGFEVIGGCDKSSGVVEDIRLTREKSAAEETWNPEDHSSTVGSKTNRCPVDGITVKVPPFAPPGGKSGPQNGHTSDILSAMPSPKAIGSRGMSQSPFIDASLLGSLCSLRDGRPNLIGSGPKKRRTQVSYSMPVEGQDLPSRFKSHYTKGFTHKRIRRPSEKTVVLPNDSGNSKGKMDSLYCDVNVLVIAGDQGRREDGAKVALELFDHSEWRLLVKICGFTRYSYKAHQFLQSCSTNRYTHAMMWKGGKDWILEFPDRSQWALFKGMHEECYNRNFRAASMKTIPMPGVRLIEESDDNGIERPFVRPLSKYYRQIQNDVDIAMDPSNVLYDMDSDDEQWVAKVHFSDETFEKIMDMLEKVAYARKNDNLTFDELKDLVVGNVSAEEIESVHEYWREKRQKKGMPLIRHLQPSLWKKYQQQLKEWELATIGHEKPPIYAFCLKPRGLELINRGSKHRSQKKITVSWSSTFSADSEACHPFGGRRFNGYAFGEETSLHDEYPPHGFSNSSPLLQASSFPWEMGSLGYFLSDKDEYGNDYYPKVHGTMSKKIGSFLFPIDQRQVFSNHSPRILGRGSRGNANLSPEWASRMYYFHPDVPHDSNFEHLDPSDRLRYASSAAQHTVNMAKLKRRKAQRLLYKADLAIHKAVVAVMKAEAIKATTTTSSMEEFIRDACSDG